ncbi:MAG: pyrimidine deaminase RibD-like protein [Gammaproteobacteria bacterium]|jgi:pyrimidine deaminase RibD-like protein
MKDKSHDYFMNLALQEWHKALSACLPNPPIVCVLVQGGVVVARGFTKQPGHRHAEASALSKTLGSLSGVVAYVTLEPCSFHGRTASCALALIECGIKEVYVAIRDPDIRNRGKGVQLLVNAGVSVTDNILSDAVSRFLSPYLSTAIDEGSEQF